MGRSGGPIILGREIHEPRQHFGNIILGKYLKDNSWL